MVRQAGAEIDSGGCLEAKHFINMTKNKSYRLLAIVLLLLGIFLVVMAFVTPKPWAKLGPMGLMCLVGCVGLLFIPAKKI